MPSRWATAAASTRLFTPSFRKMFETCRDCLINGVTGSSLSSESRLLRGLYDTARERDCKGIQGGLPAVHPTLTAASAGVEAHNRQVYALEGGGLGREMPAGLDRFADPGVDALYRVRIRYEMRGASACALIGGVG